MSQNQSKSIYFLSFRFEDRRLNVHCSDYIMSKAFERLGWTVHHIDYRVLTKKIGKDKTHQVIKKDILEKNPDILFVNKGEAVDPRLIKDLRGSKWNGIPIYWYLDQRKTIPIFVRNWQRVCNWSFHCKGGHVLKSYHAKAKRPCSFLMAPFEPSFVKDSKTIEERNKDIVWVGNSYDKNRYFDRTRHKILSSLISTNTIKEFYACYDKPFIRSGHYYSLLGNVKMVPNIPAIDQPLYFSNRQSHVMGSGAVCVMYRSSKFNRIFTENNNVIAFSDENEARERISYYLNNLGELEEIRQNSLKFAEEFMSSDATVREILSILYEGKTTYPFGEICK